jgi:haloalkane dehalogenase
VPDDLYPFEDRWAEIDGHVVHYVDEGVGPPVLLLNGNPSWSFGWRDVILQLRHRFRCIAPDYPGFGLSLAGPGFDRRPASQSQVVERLVDHLGLEGVTVFGYAWGGPIGFGFAGRRPELVRAIVIGNTWAWPDDRRTSRLFSALVGGPPGALLVDRLDLMLRLYLPLNLKRGRLSPTERAAYRGPFRREDRHTMRVFPREIVKSRAFLREVEANLARLQGKPALIVWPDSDPGFGTDELRHWQRLFPAARTVHLARTGQFIDEDAPGDVATAVETWWREEIEPGATGQAGAGVVEDAASSAVKAPRGRPRSWMK